MIVPLLLLAATLGIPGLPAAGAAASTTTFSEIAITPGHASGTVFTDAPLVKLVLDNSGHTVFVGNLVPVVDGKLDFEFETWGMNQGYLTAKPCRTSTDCDPTVATYFLTEDVIPEVVWPADTTLGPSQPFTISVNDPAGGGALEASVSLHDYPVNRFGPTTLDVEFGGLPVQIRRCNSDRSLCNNLVVTSEPYHVRRAFLSDDSRVGPQYLNPDFGTKVDVSVSSSLGLSDFTLNWSAEQQTTKTILRAEQLTESTGVTVTDGRHLSAQLDLSGLPDGVYKIRQHWTAQSEDFGPFSGSTPAGFVVVDRAVPVAKSFDVSESAFHPVSDGYKDAVRAWLVAVPDGGWDVEGRLEVVDAANVVVRDLGTIWSEHTSQAWNGRDEDKAIVPEGVYRFRATIHDDAGNETVAYSPPVTLTHGELVKKQFTRTVSASGSLVDTHLGRCSQLRRPSLRGWTGSLGLYSDTKCSRSLDASVVSTMYAVRVPGAEFYRDFRISTFGGAAKSRPGSEAWLAYMTAKGHWRNDARMESPVGTHTGNFIGRADDFFDAEGWLAWGLYTGGGRWYDVKSFTVSFEYGVLKPAPVVD